MPLPFLSAGRALLTAGLLVLALSACGRRGPSEAPPDPSVAAAQREREQQARERQLQRDARRQAGVAQGVEGQPGGPNSPQLDVEEEDESPGLGPSLAPTPAPRTVGGRRRGYVVPQEPFILDPLL